LATSDALYPDLVGYLVAGFDLGEVGSGRDEKSCRMGEPVAASAQ
jgi:hypothetical protein